MLAAVGGVLYTLATVLKLQGYSAYVQPMPIVVAAMRWGPTAGRKTMTATCFLLLGKPIMRHLHNNADGCTCSARILVSHPIAGGQALACCACNLECKCTCSQPGILYSLQSH